LPSHPRRALPNQPPAHSRYSSMDALTRPTASMSNRPRVRSMLDADPGFRRFLDQASSSPSSRAPPTPRPRLQESDVCPICRHALPPKGADGDETAREAHVMDCIAARDPSAQASSSARRQSMGLSPPPAPIHMLPFTASEKDCLGEDGTTQECSICFVEYDVGDQLARLECLCKFHKVCILAWFARKVECPVHKVA
jgi:Ring finger domain